MGKHKKSKHGRHDAKPPATPQRRESDKASTFDASKLLRPIRGGSVNPLTPEEIRQSGWL